MVQAGQRLREERIRQGLTLTDVARETKIREEFLLSIERGEYHRLPSAAYAKGFVVNYTEFLGLSRKELLALFRREFQEDKAFQVLPTGLPKQQEFPLNRLRLQQTSFIVVVLFLTLLVYIGFQYRYAVIDPPLAVVRPDENQVVDRDITVMGTTDPNAIIFVNKDIVSVDAQGNFKKIISLFPGKGTITVRAENRFGNSTVLERHVEVRSQGEP